MAIKGGEEGTYSEEFGTEFQHHILSVLARTPDAIGRFRSALDYKYFVGEVDRTIAKSLLHHYDEYRTNPSRALLIEAVREESSEEEFEACEKLVRRMFKVDINDAVAVLAKTVDFGKQQAAINAVIKVAEAVEKKRRTEIVPILQEALLVGDDLLNIGTEFSEGGETREEWWTDDEDGEKIPTGLVHLDYALDGGLGRGELGVVLAPPKAGKTTTLVNFGYGGICSAATEAGFNVIHYSFEMNEKKINRRYDRRLAGKINKLYATDRQTFVEEVEKKAQRLVRGRLFVKHYPTRTATPTMIRSHLSMLAGRGFKPDMIIFDYADIMKPERRLGEFRQETAGLYEDLRTIAGEYNAAVWTASQAPRGALEKETLDMRDFAESFEKAAVMDVGVAFCQTMDERIDGECRLFLMGLRDAEDHRTVRCMIRRDQALLKSVRLLDASMSPVETPEDDEDEIARDKADTDDEKKERPPKTTLRKVAAAAGIGKKTVKRGPKKPRKVVPGA